MSNLPRALKYVLLATVAFVFTASIAQAGDPPPNWKGSGTGTTTPVGPVDVDVVKGKQTHLGRFTGEGYHVLNPLDFTFAGQATWTASNGDTLSVTYVGQIFFSGDPDFPFGFVADLTATGGTGRLAGAHGVAVMSGAFTGVPGDFYFDFTGTLSVNGK